MKTETTFRFSNIDEYILSQSADRREVLEQLRQIIKKAAPGSQEVISYQMPAFKFHGIVAYFAAAKEHNGLYIRPKIMEQFKKQLSLYQTSKSAIRLPLNKPLPKKLIADIIKCSIKDNLDNALSKKKGKIAAKKSGK